MNNRGATRWRRSWHLVGLMLLALGSWVYMIEVRHQSFRTQALDSGTRFTEYYSDLYPSWRATVELLQHGRDPYSWGVTYDIHLAMTGEQMGADQRLDSFYYPLHFALLIAPLAYFPYLSLLPWLYAGGLALLVLALIWWAQFAAGGAGRAGIVIAGIGSIPVIDAVSIQQPVIISVVCLAGAAAALSRAGKASSGGHRRYVLAGCLFALATIKPHSMILLLPLVCLWATGDLRRRRGIFAGFGATLGVLLLGAELLSPGWIPRWLEVAANYSQQINLSPLLLSILPAQISFAVIAAGTVAMIALAWYARGNEADHPSFKLLVAAALLASYLVFPSWLYQQLLLYPAILLTIYALPELGVAARPAHLLRAGAIALVLWPMLPACLGSLLWAGGGLLAQPMLLESAEALQPFMLLPLVFLPLALLALVLTLLGRALWNNPARGHPAAITVRQ